MTDRDDTDHALDRRRFIKLGGAATLLPLVAAHTPARADTPSAGSIQRYNRLGRTDIKLSDISFGTSRLRTGEEDLVHHALDKGINYFDTADSYTRGQSETVLGRALKGKRDGVHIISKSHVSAREDGNSIMRSLDETLRRLQTDYVDVYFNHAVNDLDRLKNPEWFEFAEKARRQGKIRFTGMSGHAGKLSECLDYAVDQDLIDVMLVAYNFGQDPAFYEKLTRSFDRIATQPGLPGIIARAKAKDIGVVAMKTLMGARLNDMRPFEKAGATFAQAAFRWTLSNENVDALVISMTSRSRIDEYIGASGARTVAQGDLTLLQQYAKMNGTSYCRQACNDCDGSCPYGVPIADVLRTRMYATDYEDVDFAKTEYALLDVNASACLSCSGKPCSNACSHGLPINELCAPTHQMLAQMLA